MNKPRQYEAMLRALRKDLPAAERKELQEELERDPAMRSEWEEEQALERCLDALPKAPVSSNFTARVLAAAREEVQAPPRPASGGPLWPWLRWHLAFPAMAVVAVGLVLFQVRERTARLELADTAKTVATIAGQIAPAQQATTAVELLGNFEAVRTLARVPAEGAMDVELYMALLK